VPESKLQQNLLWIAGDVGAKFYQDQSLQGFGFALALPIPTDRQTPIFVYRD